jgi:cytidylate kinase
MTKKRKENILLLLFGLNCTGKTFFSDYLKKNYSALILHTRRIFSKTYGKDAPCRYQSYLKAGKPTKYLSDIKAQLCQAIDQHAVIVIEGMFCMEEAIWLKKHYDQWKSHIVFFTSSIHLRKQRLMKRHPIDWQEASRQIQASDQYRQGRGLDRVRADCMVNNMSEDLSKLQACIEGLMDDMVSYRQDNLYGWFFDASMMLMLSYFALRAYRYALHFSEALLCCLSLLTYAYHRKCGIEHGFLPLKSVCFRRMPKQGFVSFERRDQPSLVSRLLVKK